MWAEFAAARERAREQHDRDVRLAWLTEYMARQKRLDRSAIERVSATKARPQTVGQMKATIAMLRELFPQTGRRKATD